MIDQLVARGRQHPGAQTACDPAPPGAGAEATIRRHWAAVRRYLRVLGADAATADDLAQEAFVVALRKGIEGQDAGTAAWLRGTARNLLRNQTRKLAPVYLDVAEAVWEQRGDADDRQQALRDCMTRLTERGRTAIELAYGQRQSWAQIGATLDLQASGVKTLLRRCRDTLRACIDRATGNDQEATR